MFDDLPLALCFGGWVILLLLRETGHLGVRRDGGPTMRAGWPRNGVRRATRTDRLEDQALPMTVPAPEFRRSPRQPR